MCSHFCKGEHTNTADLFLVNVFEHFLIVFVFFFFEIDEEDEADEDDSLRCCNGKQEICTTFTRFELTYRMVLKFV